MGLDKMKDQATHIASEDMQEEGMARYWRLVGNNWQALLNEYDEEDNIVGRSWVLTEREKGCSFEKELEAI